MQITLAKGPADQSEAKGRDARPARPPDRCATVCPLSDILLGKEARAEGE